MANRVASRYVRALLINKRNIEFARAGGLSPVKQEGYNPAMPTMHSPPARKGVYAFVWPYIETFLLGVEEFKPHRMEWVKDEKGKKLKYEEDDPKNLERMEKKKYTTVFKDKATKEKHDQDFDAYWKTREGPDPLPRPVAEQYWAKHVKPRKFKYYGDIWHHLSERVPQAAVLERKGLWVKTSFDDYVVALQKEIGALEQFKKREQIGMTIDHLEVFIEDKI